MPNDNNSVQITINVVDNNSAAAVQKVEQNLTGLAGAGNNAAAAMKGVSEASAGVSNAAAAAGAAGAAGFNQMGGAVQGVRLAVQEMGLHVPRAMESIIAHNETLAAGLRMTMGLFVGIGAIGIFTQLGTAAYQLYDRWVSVNSAFDDYIANVHKAQEEDVVNVHSLETAEERFKSLNVEMGTFQTMAHSMQRDALSQGLVPGLMEMLLAHKVAVAGATAGGQSDQINRDAVEMQHRINLEELQAERAGDARLQGQAKITAELQKQYDINYENQRFTKQQDQLHGNQTPGNSGKRLQELQDEAAQGRAEAQSASVSREVSSELVRLRNEATNAALEGEALYRQQALQAEDDIRQKLLEKGATAQQVEEAANRVREKFHNQEMGRIDEQVRAATEAQNREEASRLTGIPRINRERDDAIANIDDGKDSDQAKAIRRQTAYEAADSQTLQSEQDFQHQMREIDERAQGEQLAGYARVAMEEKRQLEDLFDKYTKEYGEDEARWAGYQQHKLIIEEESNRARLQLTQKTSEQIAQIEAEAARTTLAPWQRAELQIEDQYRQRVQAARDAFAKTGGDAQQEHDLEMALARDASAKQEELAAQTRDKLAGQLQSFFDNPAKYMENRAKQMMFNVVANWTEQLIQAQGPIGKVLAGLFGQGPQQSTSTNPASSIGSVFGLGGESTSSLPSFPSNAGTGTSRPWSERIPGLGGGHAGVGIGSSAGSGALTSAGTALTGSASQLDSAAGALQTAAAALAARSGGSGSVGASAPGLPGASTSSDDNINDVAPGDWSLDGTDSGQASSGAAGVGGEVPSLPVGVSDPNSPDYTPETGSAASSLGGLSKGLGIAGAGISGALGIFQAFKTSNPLAGALSGGMAGLQLGNMIVPGIGGLVGGAIGAVAGVLAGLFGDQGLAQAKRYEQQTVQPKITADVWGVAGGQMPYGAAESDLSNLESDAMQQTNKFGSAARGYFRSNIEPEINAAMQEVKRQQAAGRDEKVTWGAVQFDSGGLVNNFGDFATGPYTGFAHLRLGERVMNQMASATHAATLDQMNAGTYSRAPQRMAAAPSSSPSGAPVQIVAWDGKSVDTWLRNGGAQKLQAAQNGNVARYSGTALGS